MKFFTSDLHLSHVNICRGVSSWDDGNSTRDFPDIKTMNDEIIRSINRKVGESDTLYILGDFAFGDNSRIPVLRDMILCGDIHLIYGNHDYAIQSNKDFRDCFSSCGHYDEVKIYDRAGRKHTVVLFHYYIGGVWNHVGRGSYHLFGHSHGSLNKNYIVGKAFDIGWDVWCGPLSEHEVCDEMNKLTGHARWLDHHTEKTSYA